MKKTLIYIVLLAVAALGAWYFFFHEHSIFSSRDAGFTLRDTGAIGKIFLATKNGESIKLERSENGWLINGKYPARPASVNQLLQTLNAQIAQAPVSETMHNSVVRSITNGHVKVEIYNREGRPMRIFYVGGETQSGNGTFMLMEGGSRPYVVQIPGFTGYLTPRYLPTLASWRDRLIFNVAAADVTRIRVRNFLEPLNSFSLTKQGDKVQVQIDPSLMEGKTLNARRANVYPTYLEKVYAEQVVNGVGGVREEISKMPQRFRIEVEGKNNYHQDIDLFFMPISRRSKNLDQQKTDTTSYFDSDRMYGVANNHQDTLVVQIQMVKKLFRRGYEFYMQDDAPRPDVEAALGH